MRYPDSEQFQSASPVALLPLILIPIVISGFLLVYSLVGVILEGDSSTRWRDEAWQVTFPTVLIQMLCCAVIVMFGYYKKLAWLALLKWLGVIHSVLACILLAIVYYLTFSA